MKKIESGVTLNVGEFYDSWAEVLGLEVVAGKAGFNRDIRSNRVQKPGLRMVETNIELESGKIQVLGRSEIDYFMKLSGSAGDIMSEVLAHQNVPCYILSKGLPAPSKFVEAFDRQTMPLFTTSYQTGKLISFLNEALEERLAPFTTLHGLLIDIYGLGVLLLGKSGIGKSECALDLILRGAKLIADDVVLIQKVGTSKLQGTGPENIKHLMEIRGVGIINIKDMFGTASVMDKRVIEMVIELKSWDNETEYERVGIDENTMSLMDVGLPYTVLPVSPGRNTATIIEVAVRNQLLRSSGSTAGTGLEKTTPQAGKA